MDGNGVFRSDMAALGTLVTCNREARRQLADEVTAQFAAFQATGLALDHCNAHKHFHLHPVIGALLASIGARFGLRAARVPLEPTRVLRKIEPQTPWAPALLMMPWVMLLGRRIRAAGLLTADRVFGLQWSGHMTRDRLLGLLHHLPDGLTEIYLHPATGPYPGSAPGYRYREELAALTSAEVVAARRDASLQLGGFQDFLSPGAAVHTVTAGAPRAVAPP